MTARAATPLADILTALEDAGQVLAFDPLRPHGEMRARGTIGGLMAISRGRAVLLRVRRVIICLASRLFLAVVRVFSQAAG